MYIMPFHIMLMLMLFDLQNVLHVFFFLTEIEIPIHSKYGYAEASGDYIQNISEIS
jgi:hypothetical protein